MKCNQRENVIQNKSTKNILKNIFEDNEFEDML